MDTSEGAPKCKVSGFAHPRLDEEQRKSVAFVAYIAPELYDSHELATPKAPLPTHMQLLVRQGVCSSVTLVASGGRLRPWDVYVAHAYQQGAI